MAGNHEFDWGRDHLVAQARQLPFPLLAANDDIGLPGTLLIETPQITVGLLGLTQLNEPRPGPFWTLTDWNEDLRSAAELGTELAIGLRTAGADLVVAGVHAGAQLVDDGSGPPRADLADMELLCRAWASAVDCVMAAHTLARHIGPVGGVAFLQPWAYGAEIGVLDIWPDGRRTASAVGVNGAEPWGGYGAAQLDAARSTLVGVLHDPLTQRPGDDVCLGRGIARAIAARSQAGSALVLPWELCTQPPIDGAYAYLPAAPVHESDVLRLAPYVGSHVPDRVLVTDLAPARIDQVLARMPAQFGEPPIERGEAPGFAVTCHATGIVDAWLGEHLDWQDAGFGVAEAVRDVVEAAT